MDVVLIMSFFTPDTLSAHEAAGPDGRDVDTTNTKNPEKLRNPQPQNSTQKLNLEI